MTLATFSLDTRDARKFEKMLLKIKERAYPFATKQTLNSAAFSAMQHARENVRSKMVTRNKFTERSIQVEPARGLNVRAQAAFVGSTEDYMETQEFGGIRSRRGARGVPIPTTTASGEGKGARVRRRVPRKTNKLENIRFSSRTLRGGRRQRNVVAIKQTVAAGRKFVFLDLRRHPGIYRLAGGKRNPRIELVWDLSNPSVTIPKTPWLAPATKVAADEIPAFYEKALRFQLKRLGVIE